MSDLNQTEQAVLKSLVESSAGNGHDFGWTDEVNAAAIGITKAQVSGYVSQLVQKGYIESLADYDDGWENGFKLTTKGHDFGGTGYQVDESGNLIDKEA